MDEFINKGFTYAVIGASNNPEKYGCRIVKDLHGAGYDVVPINPREREVLGLRAFASLAAAGRRIDVAVFVVPPAVTESVLREVVALGINKVWLQPGSSSDKAVRFCADNGLACVHDSCIMVERR